MIAKTGKCTSWLVLQSSTKVLVDERETEREQKVKDFVYNF